MRVYRLTLGVVAAIVVSCASGRESGERPRATVPATPPPANVDARAAPIEVADAAVDSKEDAESDAAAEEETGGRREVAHGRGACPDWRPWSDEAFRHLRSGDTPSFPKGYDATCCALTDDDVLCRTRISAEHVLDATYGTSLVGVHRGSRVPWLEVPVEVRQHRSMVHGGPLLVRLKVTTNDGIVTLAVALGACPPVCMRTPGGCHLAGADAKRACAAAGSYQAGDPQKRP